MKTTYAVAPEEVTVSLLGRVLKSQPRFDPIRENDLRIEILKAIRTDGKPAVRHHGAAALAQIKIVGAEERSTGGPDVRIKIDWARWLDLGPKSREAILAHELYHVEFAKTNEGNLKRDDYDRPIVRLIPDDWSITGFKEVADWYGEDSIEKRSFNTLGEILSQATFDFKDDPPVEDLSDAPHAESGLIEDTFKALLSVGHTEAQARAAIDRVCSGPRFAECKSVSDLIDVIYQGDGDSESGPGAEPDSESEVASISFSSSSSSHPEAVTLTSKHFEAIGEIEKKIRARAASSV
jgi:hypothetical protein